MLQEGPLSVMEESLEKYTDPDAIRETSDNEPMGYSAHNGSPIEGSEPFNTDGTEDTEDGDAIMVGVVGSAAPWFLTGWTNDQFLRKCAKSIHKLSPD